MNKNTIVETQMLIRKPVATVFEAFIDPAVTTNFWFTKSSGKLEVGKKIVWEWEMYNASATYVFIKNYGFNLEGDELIRTVMDNTGGFTTVLDGLKAFLEHHINLNLIADKFAKK